MRRRHLRTSITANAATVDLTAMIDIVFLLLVFFILTTSFTSEPKMLAVLMPPTGQAKLKSAHVPPPTIRIAVVPAGLPEQRSEADYQDLARDLRQSRIDRLSVRMGGEIITDIDVGILRRGDSAAQLTEIHRIQAAIHAGLVQREISPESDRSQAAPIEIHAWSGLPWAGVTSVFDAVRAYERDTFASSMQVAADLPHLRPVAFAAPAIRNYTRNQDGRELADLLVLR